MLSITSIIAQENKSIEKNIPASIYTSIKVSQDFNSILNINQRLQLKSFTFLVIDEKNIEEGFYTLPICSLTKSPTKYIYDSYNKVYQTKNLKQAFFKVSDLYKVRTKNPF